jgi:hypothetical protein
LTLDPFRSPAIHAKAGFGGQQSSAGADAGEDLGAESGHGGSPRMSWP